MSERELNLYSDGHDDEIDAEKKRLRSLEYPSQVSIGLIKGLGNIEGKRILDVGSGENNAVGKYVKGEGGIYIPMDIRKGALYEQIGFPVQGEIEHLPFANKSIDISHTRFVLGWLNDRDKRQKALREIARVSVNSALLLEYDWSFMGGPTVINELRVLLANEVLPRFGFDPYYGGILHEEVDSWMSGIHEIDDSISQREQGDYFNETLSLIEAIEPRLGILNNNRIIDELLRIKQHIIELIQSNDVGENDLFIPPSIRSLKVTF